MLKKWVFVSIFLLMAGCARQLVPLGRGESVVLEPKQGLLLFAVDSKSVLEEIKFKGRHSRVLSKEQLGGTRYFLAVVPAGKYRLGEIVVGLPPELTTMWGEKSGTWYPSDDKSRDWEFVIEPGKTNYVGHFRVEEVSRMFVYNVYLLYYDLVNRSSFAHEYMRKYHPEQLKKYPIKFSGFGEDSYFEEIAKLTEEADK